MTQLTKQSSILTYSTVHSRHQSQFIKVTMYVGEYVDFYEINVAA